MGRSEGAGNDTTTNRQSRQLTALSQPQIPAPK
jgi:hypothetical protein